MRRLAMGILVLGIGCTVTPSTLRAQNFPSIEQVKLDYQIGFSWSELSQDEESASPSSAGHGVHVTAVQPGSPSDSAGLRSNDIITKINGKIVTSISEAQGQISKIQPGRRIRIEAYREGVKRPLQLEIIPTLKPIEANNFVYRGKVSTPQGNVWVELVSREGQPTQIVILDGVPSVVFQAEYIGGFPHPEYGPRRKSAALASGTRIGLSIGVDQNGTCVMQGEGVFISACPRGSIFAAGEVSLEGYRGNAVFVPVTAAASIAQNGFLVSNQRSKTCGYEAFRTMLPLSFSNTRIELARLDRQNTGLTQRSPWASIDVSSVRRDRLSAFAAMNLNEAELHRREWSDRNRRLSMASGNWRGLAQVADEERQGEQNALNSPARIAALRTIADTDRQLEALYADPALESNLATIRTMQTDSIPRFIGAFEKEIDTEAGLSLTNLLDIERQLPSISACLRNQSVGSVTERINKLPQVVNAKFVTMNSLIASELDASLQQSNTVVEVDQLISQVESSGGLMAAINASGQGGLVQRMRVKRSGLAEAELAKARKDTQLARAEADKRAAQEALVAQREAQRQALAARNGPTSEEIRTALLYERAYGVTNPATMIGLASQSVDYSTGTFTVSTFGIELKVKYVVSDVQCKGPPGGSFVCSYTFDQRTALQNTSWPTSNTFVFRSGRWRSPTFQAAILAENSGPSSSSSTRNCTVQGFGTLEGPAIRDQNGLRC